MPRLTKIYTRTGDDGSTGLVDGSRARKDGPRINAIGDVDEANSALGLAIAQLGDAPADIIDSLTRIQHELFDLGADLATPDGIDGALRIVAAQPTRLEEEMDALNETLSPLENFILPGGNAGVAALYLARAVVRRAERGCVMLAASEPVNAHALAYINRLSDHLFVTARAVAAHQGGDIVWQPGSTR